LPYHTKISTSDKDGVEVVFEEQADGRITVSFEGGGNEDADVFSSHFSDALATYKGQLAAAKRKAQVTRDREARLAELKAMKKEHEKEPAPEGQPAKFTDADQAELDHLTELKKQGEL